MQGHLYLLVYTLAMNLWCQPFYLLLVFCFSMVIHWPWIHNNPKNLEPQHTYQLWGPGDDQHRVAPLRATQERIFKVSTGSRHHALLSSQHVHETVESWDSHMLHRRHHLHLHLKSPPDSLCHHGNSTHSFHLPSDGAFLSWLQHEGRSSSHQRLGQPHKQCPA